jgi:hypothetical protein
LLNCIRVAVNAARPVKKVLAVHQCLGYYQIPDCISANTGLKRNLVCGVIAVDARDVHGGRTRAEETNDGMRHRRIRTFFLATLAIVVSCAGAYSQTPSTGALKGVTLNPTGAVLPGVVVHIANQDTGASAAATSNNEGRFSFLLLAPGRYDVQASRAGFATLVVKPTINDCR